MNLKRIITLDVGGTTFRTTKATLMREANSMLEVMVSGRHDVDADQSDFHFIDRDPTHFRYVLNYLRDGGECVLPHDLDQREEIMTEARYYGLEGLLQLLSEETSSSRDQGGKGNIVITDGHPTTNPSTLEEGSSADLKPGHRVLRGPDWRYDNQDGGTGHIGRVIQLGEDWNGKQCWVHVKWPNGHFNGYRYGIDGAYDVVPAPESHDMPLPAQHQNQMQNE